MRKHYSIPPLILQTTIWPVTWFLFHFFLHLKIHGLENLRHLSPGVIFASNHSSEWDVILIPASLPFLSRFMPMFYVASDDKDFNHSRFGWRRHLYGGLFFNAWGAYPVIRGQRDYNVSLKTHAKLLEEKRSLSIFPEGGISSRNSTRTAHGGVAYLAHKTSTPIIPVAINGIALVTFRDFILRRRYVTIHFGKPKYSKDLFNDSNEVGVADYKKAAEKVMEGIHIQV